MSTTNDLISEDVKRHFRERVRYTLKKEGIFFNPFLSVEVAENAEKSGPASGRLNEVVNE